MGKDAAEDIGTIPGMGVGVGLLSELHPYVRLNTYLAYPFIHKSSGRRYSA
jgi:hypothetical protein